MKLLLSAAAGVLSMLAFTLPREGYVGISDLPLQAFSPVWLLYAALLAGLWYVFFTWVKRVSVGQICIGLVFGAVNYFAAALFAYDTWRYLNGLWPWCRAVLQMLGQAAVMTMAAALVCRWLESRGRESMVGGRLIKRLAESRLARLYRRRPILFVMGALFVCWLPYLVVFYPGTVVWDMAEMVAMQYGLREMTTWHPVFMTWLFSGCVRLGRVFGSDNLGVFCFTLLQSAILAYALARTLELVRKLNVSRAFRLGTLLFFACTPIFASFAQAVGKDTVYAAVVLLLTVQMIEWIRFEQPKRNAVIALALTALLVCLTRNNGIYLLIPAVLVLVLVLRGKTRGLAAAALGGALVVFLAFNSLLVPALGIPDATASGVYSIAFQQTARALRDHGGTAEEMAAINQVLDAETLAERYETNISDPVKYTFKQYGLGREVEQEALRQYRATWLRMLAKYPLTYLEAFVAGSTGYYAFTPKIDAARTYNYQGGMRFLFETVAAGGNPLDLHTTQPAAFAKARELLAMAARGWRRVPVLELFLFCASYTWLLAIAALSLLRQKRARDLAAFLPALMSLCVCVFSPVNDYFRYFLPIVAVFVPLMGLAKQSALSYVTNEKRTGER